MVTSYHYRIEYRISSKDRTVHRGNDGKPVFTDLRSCDVDIVGYTETNCDVENIAHVFASLDRMKKSYPMYDWVVVKTTVTTEEQEESA